jgi:hypothetical protein
LVPFEKFKRLIIAGSLEKVRELWVHGLWQTLPQLIDPSRNLLQTLDMLRNVASARLIRDDRETLAESRSQLNRNLVHQFRNMFRHCLELETGHAFTQASIRGH